MIIFSLSLKRLIRRAFVFVVVAMVSMSAGYAQEFTLTQLAALPEVLKESSAIEVTSNGNIWTIVDSKYSILYNINTKGEVGRTIHLDYKNEDWEEMTQDDRGNFYIGAFGNNANKRQNLKIYKIPPPDSIKKTLIGAEVIKFKYADQNAFPPSAVQMQFDMEAMVSFGDALYLFSKNRTKPYTGYSRLYKLPNTPGQQVAELIDSVYLGPGPMLQTWVTGAALSPDKKILALLSHDKIWLFYCFEGDKFFSGRMTKIELNNFSQKEAICFINNTELYLSDERYQNILGGNLYHLQLHKDYSAECND